jgi:hypothetical protein
LFEYIINEFKDFNTNNSINEIMVNDDDYDVDNVNSNVDNYLPIEKKKRGRKPKSYYTNLMNENLLNRENEDELNSLINTDLLSQIQTQQTPQTNQLLNNDFLTIKKRGRKANTKIINLSHENNNLEIITNLIAHLPLKMNDILKISNEKNNKINSNYDQDDISHISQKTNVLKENEPKIVENKMKYVDINDENIYVNPHCSNKVCKKCQENDSYIQQLESEIKTLKNVLSLKTRKNKKINRVVQLILKFNFEIQELKNFKTNLI